MNRSALLIAFLCLLFSSPLVVSQTGEETTDGTTGDMTTGSITSGSTTGASTTGASTTGYTVPVYKQPVTPNQNVTVALNVSGASLKVKLNTNETGLDLVYAEAADDVDSDYQDPTSTKPQGSNYRGVSFVLSLYNGTEKIIKSVFSIPIELTIAIPNGNADDQLFLFDLERALWVNAASTCSNPFSDFSNNELKVKVCHLTQFAVFSVPAEPEPVDSKRSDVESDSSAGAVAGAVIGAVLGACLLTAIAAVVYRRYHAQRRSHHLETGIELTAPTKKIDQSSSEEETSAEEEEEEEEEEDEEEESSEDSGELKKNAAPSTDNKKKEESSEESSSSEEEESSSSDEKK